MMISEFIDRTGFEPTASEYAKIEEAYYDFPGDKDAFCKAFVSNAGEKKICRARAEEIARLNSSMMEAEKRFNAEIEARDHQIENLKKALDKEMEWKPCEGGTTMKQADYLRLALDGRKLTEQEAKELIADEFGFSPEKVTILTEVNTYEANKYGQSRVADTFDRVPTYEATDWNYIRFDCANFMYEMVNGNLRFYCI